ncbi:hypothetical protein [Megamonas hypermegale]|uniref:hypothetical protein n=1 Tax=Megamonas hypermegale TaxID=158847 RepID=UPI0026F069B0|nr:hypothetical protein [Megamonas hypermegale]
MNNKAAKFQEYLTANNITGFNHEEFSDEFHTVMFRSRIVIKGQEIPMAIILDDSIYRMIRIQLVSSVENTTEVVSYLNKLNAKYKSYKFYLTEQNNLILDSCVMGKDEDESEVIIAVLNNIIKQMQDEYSDLMHVVWSK